MYVHNHCVLQAKAQFLLVLHDPDTMTWTPPAFVCVKVNSLAILGSFWADVIRVIT